MTLPVQTQAVADERGLLTPTWRRWLADLERRVGNSQNDSLAADIAAIATALGSPDGTVANIPEQANTDALIVGLDGILTEGRLSSGRVTVRLADLEDTGVGAGLYKITRDDKGRVEGTEAATATDLPYDNTTSGLTATDAQAAIDELAAGGGAGGSSDGFDSSLVTFAHNDFTVLTEWTSTGAGTASGASAANAAGRAGIVDLTTGTSTTGFRYYHDPAGLAFYLGGGAEIELIYGFKIPALSDGTNRFSFLAGLTDNVASASSNRLALRYSDDVNSGNWTIRSNVGSTTGTDVTGSFGPTAGTWYRARIVINAAGTSADVYVKAEGAAEQLVGTTTAVPSAVMYNVLSIAKMTGTTARSVLCDFATRRHRYSTPR